MGMNCIVSGYDGHVQFKVIAFEAKNLSSNTKKINEPKSLNCHRVTHHQFLFILQGTDYS